MKKTLVILLIGSFMGCTIASTRSSSHTNDSVSIGRVVDDITSFLWVSVVDSMKEVGLKNVIDNMVPHDLAHVIEKGRILNGEKKIRDLYPHYQVGDTLFFIQHIECSRYITHFTFWKKGDKVYNYRYRPQPNNMPDTVFIRQFDERELQYREFFKACEDWNVDYLSNSEEYHKHKSQRFIFRVIIKEKGEFQMDYVSRVFQERRDLFL